LSDPRHTPLTDAQETPRFDRLCIAILAVEWIVFGSMHFSYHDATVQQIPDFIPYKPMVAVVTGMLEVAIGMLILVPGVRRWAALASLILLLLYIPAVYKILADDATLFGPPEFRAAFRVLLVPNNVFLALCSIHLWRHPGTSSIRTAVAVEETLARRRPMTNAKATLLVAFLLLVANCAGFLAIMASPLGKPATAYLWAMMCIALGAFVGFLFAVPRFNPQAAKTAVLLPNTNIEQVSDWLTKIIVGVGLIHLKEIGAFLVAQSNDLATAIGADSTFALGLILYFFVAGVIQGYLLTRLFLAWQFSLSGPASEADTRPAPQVAVPPQVIRAPPA
jgi:uncharacterized membrane protein